MGFPWASEDTGLELCGLEAAPSRMALLEAGGHRDFSE